MKILTKERAFELAQFYFEMTKKWPQIKESWEMIGIKEVKPFWGLTLGLASYRCHVCEAKMSYYNIIARRRHTDGKLVGKPRPLPMPIQVAREVFSVAEVLGNPEFGVCPDGHETVRLRVRYGEDICMPGNLIHSREGKRMVCIGVPSPF